MPTLDRSQNGQVIPMNRSLEVMVFPNTLLGIFYILPPHVKVLFYMEQASHPH